MLTTPVSAQSLSATMGACEPSAHDSCMRACTQGSMQVEERCAVHGLMACPSIHRVAARTASDLVVCYWFAMLPGLACLCFWHSGIQAINLHPALAPSWLAVDALLLLLPFGRH
jgi:hypothetical protein